MSRYTTAAVDLMSEVATQPPGLARDTTKVRILIVSDVRFYREALASRLGQNERLTIVGAVECGDALGHVKHIDLDVVLLDVAEWHGLDLARTLLVHRPELSIVALAVPDIVGHSLAAGWPGIVGFVSRNGSIDDVMSLLEGSPACARGGRVALAAPDLVQSDVLRRGIVPALADLTPRECEILDLIELGLSNKEIARKLLIEIGTVKNHVHNILEKLNVRCRKQAAHCMRARSLSA